MWYEKVPNPRCEDQGKISSDELAVFQLTYSQERDAKGNEQEFPGEQF